MKTAVLFRYDLRLSDNPALYEARKNHVLPIFICPEDTVGENSDAYLSMSLQSLNESLNNRLIVLKSTSSLPSLLKKYDIENVYWNRAYTPKQIKSDTELKQKLKKLGLNPKSFNGNLLFEPWEILKDDDTPYSVYTPFYKKCSAHSLREVVRKPSLTLLKHSEPNNLPKPSALLDGKASEKEAKRKLQYFIEHNLKGYKHNRDFFAKDATSKLSCHLRFGEISPHYIWETIKSQEGRYPDGDIEWFLKELIWREFSYYQLYHFPQLPNKNWQEKFDQFPWQKNAKYLKAWQEGNTGIPLVDAGMRELKTTGYMHNRVRMVTASFLVKNLLIHWKEGEEWFWEHLYDADMASNNANWQWVAGCGFDAAPYFRIFNPILQSKKFDPDGEYLATFIPELEALAPKDRHEPWGLCNYIDPIVDLKASRDAALKALSSIKLPR